MASFQKHIGTILGYWSGVLVQQYIVQYIVSLAQYYCTVKYYCTLMYSVTSITVQ